MNSCFLCECLYLGNVRGNYRREGFACCITLCTVLFTFTFVYCTLLHFTAPHCTILHFLNKIWEDELLFFCKCLYLGNVWGNYRREGFACCITLCTVLFTFTFFTALYCTLLHFTAPYCTFPKKQGSTNFWFLRVPTAW